MGQLLFSKSLPIWVNRNHKSHKIIYFYAYCRLTLRQDNINHHIEYLFCRHLTEPLLNGNISTVDRN